jgi:CHAT domain
MSNAKNKEILSANELKRVDRIPKFVFSNACESGITPDRSQERSVDLAPSFAEAFFARGVANFVCTAWPVDDFAARVFALILYSSLLGIRLDRQSLGLVDNARDDKVDVNKDSRQQAPMLMHEAMRQARITIASLSTGRLTWGAYQHYGNPYFHFFQKSPTDPQAEVQGPGDVREATAAVQKTSAEAESSAAQTAESEAPAPKGRSSAVSTQDPVDESTQPRTGGRRRSMRSPGASGRAAARYNT